LFAQRPTLPFRSAQSDCPDCHAPLKVLKTRVKTVHTLHLGSFTAQETVQHCDQCPNPSFYAAEALQTLAPAGSTVGYDVVNYVGQGLFVRHRRAPEIVTELAAQNIDLSPSEVLYLGKKFVVYLALAHRQSAPRLKKAFRAKGGYILHLDGLGEGGGPRLMSSLDSLSEIVLGNVKVPSENTAAIVRFLKLIKRRYGVPVAIVHDLGAGLLAAVKIVFPGVPDFICHFHFLRDLGQDLLDADYEAIRQRLRHHGITETLQQQARQLKNTLAAAPQADGVERFCQSLHTQILPATALGRFPLLTAYSLIQWALAGKTQGQGYGYPFDRPQVELAQRLQAVAQHLEGIKHLYLRHRWEDNEPLFKLANALKPLAADTVLQKRLAAIAVKIPVFDQLRTALRIAEVDGSGGLNSGSEPVALGPIRQAVQTFRQQLMARPDYATSRPWQSLIAQLDKYDDKLFADPITVETAQGPRRIQPQRTNNLMERFFRDFRNGARRRSGQNSMSRFLQSMLADTPLVKNLENPEYLKMLLNGQPSLEACFAQIDTELVRREMAVAQQNVEQVPQKIRQLIQEPGFTERLCSLFRKSA
jgi:hypothetical protein